MDSMKCAPQKAYKLILSFLVLASATVLFILGISLLPVIGILLSLPTFAIAVYIYNLHVNDQCDIEMT